MKQCCESGSGWIRNYLFQIRIHAKMKKHQLNNQNFNFFAIIVQKIQWNVTLNFKVIPVTVGWFFFLIDYTAFFENFQTFKIIRIGSETFSWIRIWILNKLFRIPNTALKWLKITLIWTPAGGEECLLCPTCPGPTLSDIYKIIVQLEKKSIF